MHSDSYCLRANSKVSKSLLVMHQASCDSCGGVLVHMDILQCSVCSAFKTWGTQQIISPDWSEKTDTKPVVQFRKESFVFNFYFDLLAKQVSSLRLVLNQIHVVCFWKSEEIFSGGCVHVFVLNWWSLLYLSPLVSFVCLCDITLNAFNFFCLFFSVCAYNSSS